MSPSGENSIYAELAIRSGEEFTSRVRNKWVRTDRFIRVANEWYFSTRENRDVGPYNNRSDAAHGLELFIECIDNLQKSVDYANSIALIPRCSSFG